MEYSRTLKCVVVGDATVGKTFLLIRYTLDHFPKDYDPTVFDVYSVNLDSSVGRIKLDLQDTAGNEGYEDLRALALDGANIFLLCFAVDNTNSFKNVSSIWYNEVRKANPNAVIILVATKSDLRKNGAGKVGKPQIEMLARKLRLTYMECSALTRENIKEVFSKALEEALLKEINKTTNSLDTCSWERIKSVLCCK